MSSAGSARKHRGWPGLLRAGLLDPRTTTGWIIRHLHSLFDAVEPAPQSTAGNLKVFEEIGEVFARSLDDPGFEPDSPLLREAFAHYEDCFAHFSLNPNVWR